MEGNLAQPNSDLGKSEKQNLKSVIAFLNVTFLFEITLRNLTEISIQSLSLIK